MSSRVNRTQKRVWSSVREALQGARSCDVPAAPPPCLTPLAACLRAPPASRQAPYTASTLRRAHPASPPITMPTAPTLGERIPLSPPIASFRLESG